MLIYEKNGDIFAFAGVEIEGSFNCGVIGLLVDHEEVFGGIRGRRDMLRYVSDRSIDRAATVG
jgi:hypothetical protein